MSRRPLPRPSSMMLVWLFVCGGAAVGARAATFTWTGGANSPNWSAISGVFFTNWAGNTKPVSAAATDLVFNNSTSSFTPLQDIASPFTLNSITFGSAQFTLLGNQIQFSASVGVNPAIVQNSPLLQRIDNDLFFASPTTLSGSAGNGGISLSGTVAGSGSLTDGVATTLSGGAVTLAGPQTYNAPLTLGTATTLISTGAAAITINGTLNGAQGLAINTAGNTLFGGAVGASTPLASLTTDAPGTTTISGGAINTSGPQLFNDPVTLGAAATLHSNGSQNVTFASTVNGGFALAVNTGGMTIFTGAVGGGTALTSVQTDAQGSTVIGGGSVVTSLSQSYSDPVQISAPTTLTSTSNANIFFSTTLNGSFPLTVNTAGTTFFTGAVGGSAPLASLTVSGTASIKSNISTGGAQAYNGAVTLAANATLASGGAAANVNFAGTVNGASALTVNSAGTTTFGGAVGGGTALTSVTTNAPGGTAINGGSVTTSGAQTYADPVVLGANTTLTSTAAGNVSLASVNGPFSLTVNTGGTTSLGAADSGTPLTSLTTDTAGGTTITGDAVTTTGAQSYNDAVTLANSVVFTSNGSGNLAFANTLNGPFNARFNTGGGTNLSGRVGNTAPLASLQIDSAGTTNYSGGSVTTTGDQHYLNRLVLGANATFSTTAPGSVVSFDTVNGAFAFNVNSAGDALFGGRLGNTSLGSLTVSTAGNTNLNATSVSTSGSQTYNGPVVIGEPTTLTSTGGGNITFNNSLNGAFPLIVNTAGVTSFARVGGPGPLTSITTDAAGTTVLAGLPVLTSGNQTYNDPVSITGAPLVQSTGGDITFGNTVNGGSTVQVFLNTGTLRLNAAVGNTTLPNVLLLGARTLHAAAITANSISASFVDGTFSGPLHGTFGGVQISGDTFTLTSVASDSAPIGIVTRVQSEVSGVISGNAILVTDGGGVLTLSGNNTYAGATTVQHGLLRVSGSIASSSGLTVNGGAQFIADTPQILQRLTLFPGANVLVAAAVLKVGNGAAASPLSITTTGPDAAKLNIATHGLIVDYAAGNDAANLANVRALVASGFHGGDWAGSGVVSGNATVNTNAGVGYAQGGDVVGAGGGSFFGLDADASSILIRYTLLGDATLDGTVDFNDLVKLAQNYNVADGERVWFDGDFTYDGNVDFNDLVKLAQNYNTALPGTAVPGAGAGFDVDLARAFASVPEPPAVWAVAIGAAIGAARARRPGRPNA